MTYLRSWAEALDEANAESGHTIIARLMEQVEIVQNFEVKIRFGISAEPYMRIAANRPENTNAHCMGVF